MPVVLPYYTIEYTPSRIAAIALASINSIALALYLGYRQHQSRKQKWTASKAFTIGALFLALVDQLTRAVIGFQVTFYHIDNKLDADDTRKLLNFLLLPTFYGAYILMILCSMHRYERIMAIAPRSPSAYMLKTWRSILLLLGVTATVLAIMNPFLNPSLFYAKTKGSLFMQLPSTITVALYLVTDFYCNLRMSLRTLSTMSSGANTNEKVSRLRKANNKTQQNNRKKIIGLVVGIFMVDILALIMFNLKNYGWSRVAISIGATHVMLTLHLLHVLIKVKRSENKIIKQRQHEMQELSTVENGQKIQPVKSSNHSEDKAPEVGSKGDNFIFSTASRTDPDL